MSERIAASLARFFEEKRIVFWYDVACDMRETFDALDMPNVTKLIIANNEFGLKYRILRQEPHVKFLLFYEGAEPPLAENWLLDVQLSSGVFKADQTTIWLSELGLELAFAPVLQDHVEFFRSKHRVDALKKIRQPNDTPGQMRQRMLAICAGAQGGLDTVVEALLADLSDNKEDGLKLIERVGLMGFLWKQVANAYGYETDTPDIEDFAILLFKACYAMGLHESSMLNAEALLMFRRWKNDKAGSISFERLSARYAEVLQISNDIAKRDFRDLIDIDYFEEIDREIIRKLVQGLSAQTLTPGEV